MSLFSKRTSPLEIENAVLIAGSMGVGKSTLFEKLCPAESRRSVKIQGVGVQAGRLRGRRFVRTLLDAPGIYSIFSQNEDEMVSRHLLLSGRIGTVLQVLDAKNLRRSLVLALELAEFGLPTCFVLNMMDEAENRGITISIRQLETKLGGRVQGAVLSEDHGLAGLRELIVAATKPAVAVSFPQAIEGPLSELTTLLSGTTVAPRALGVLLLGRSESTQDYVRDHFGHGMLERVNRIVEAAEEEVDEALDVVMTKGYAAQADRIVAGVQRVQKPPPRLITLLGRWAQRLSTGIPMAILILVAMYYWVGAFGATFLVDLLNNEVFGKHLAPMVKQAVAPIPSEFVRSALVDDDFGVLTTGLFLAFGIVLPVLFCFYLLFGLLEESGYWPRFSVLLHRVLSKIGLTGKGMVPLIMGLSCVTMALLTVKILETKKERIIASFLLMLALPCAPLLAVMLVILAPMPWSTTAFVFGFIVIQGLVAGWLASKIIPGARSDMIMELPPMRVPKLRTLLSKTWRRTYYFMKEAVPVFLVAAFVLFLINYFGGLELLARVTRPIVSDWLGLPEQSVRVFIKTLIRRENGAAELDLLRAHFSQLQLVVTMLVMVLLVPCVNTIIVLLKEQRIRTALAILSTVLLYALLVGGLVNHACRALGVTFG